MKHSVFVTRAIPGSGIQMVREKFEVDVWDNKFPPDRDEIASRARNCTGLISLLSDPIDAALMDELPNLKIVSQYAVGYDNIDVQAATERGIMVTNTPGVLTDTTADLAWALIMATARRLVEADSYVRGGNWKVAWGPSLLTGQDIHGKTLGIIGLGRIGSAVARRAKGFDMEILYHTRSRNHYTDEVDDELGGRSVPLGHLLSESDIISMHVPLNEQTEGMIGKDELFSMKKSAILINTSRGAVVDEESLIWALQNGEIWGAGLDVFEEEPTQEDNPLLSLNNVVVAPHIGSASIDTRSKMGIICAENLVAGLKGDKPPNLVNREVIDND
ncbi:D-glycerate dehydrogenase [Candidatus Thorarchaeota archaeon]|nr:MAG: D-glycerate dehydrogenase [Candidatus Thorarchaeota archaeon]